MGSFSSEKLLYYLSAARAASPKTAKEICVQATADPALYEFGELLASPSIAALKGTADHNHYELLRLFAHGTVDDYRTASHSFPPLSDSHWKKLRVLTLVSLADGRSVLQYALLEQKLAVETVRQVEDVVLHAVYAGLIRARMDQRAGRVEIASAVGRDVVTPEGVSEMISSLKLWVQRSTQLVEEIDDKINYIASHTATVAKHKAEANAHAEAARKMVLADTAFQVDLMSANPPPPEFDLQRERHMQSWDVHPNVPAHRSRTAGTRFRR